MKFSSYEGAFSHIKHIKQKCDKSGKAHYTNVFEKFDLMTKMMRYRTKRNQNYLEPGNFCRRGLCPHCQSGLYHPKKLIVIKTSLIFFLNLIY